MKIPALKKFDQISDKARENIYALVMKHYQKHPNSPWSGRYLVELENSIKKFYQEMGAQYQGAFRDTLPDMMKEFYDRAKEEIKTAGTYKAIKGEPDAKRIKYFLDNSFEQVAMRTDKMSFDHIRSLRQLSAEVFREMAVTGHTRREVSKALFERAMKIPGFEFTDKAGSKWQAKSYFKMLARTELMNASRECYDDKMSEEGFDVMRLTISGDPCDSCSKYENRLFSLTGATEGLPTKADLEAAGVFHPNCTHTYVLVPDFIRLRDYNPDGTRKNDEQRKLNTVPSQQQYKGVNSPLENYRKIEGKHSALQDIKATNPNYELDPTNLYHINCQRCVPTYEARRRGFDVEALPAVKGNDPVLSNWDKIFDGAKWIKNNRNLPDKQFIEEQMKNFGNGCRAEIYVKWRGQNAGHVFVAENTEGKILFSDPQSGKEDVSHYFAFAEKGYMQMCRVDNLKFSDYIKQCCQEVKK